jgi:DNA replication protein DnaC
MSARVPSVEGLDGLLRGLKLPTFVSQRVQVAKAAQDNAWSFDVYLRQLVELEITERRKHRVERLRKQSGLPDKTLRNLDTARLPTKVARLLPELCEGRFLRDATNVLAFGLPGRGKTHLLSAVGHALIDKGHAVLFRPTALFVQQLLTAKRGLGLEQEIKRLDRFEAVILDDIGYVQQDRDEMEVLFTFLAARYERRSVLISSNLVFSQWDRIFKDPMTTAAAIDRIVHHSVILEMNGGSIREEHARARTGSRGPTTTTAEAATAPMTATTPASPMAATVATVSPMAATAAATAAAAAAAVRKTTTKATKSTRTTKTRKK